MTTDQELFCVIDMAFRAWAEGRRLRGMSATQSYRALWRLAARGAVMIELDDADESFFGLKFVPAWRVLQRRRNAAGLKRVIEIYRDRENRWRPGRLMAG